MLDEAVRTLWRSRRLLTRSEWTRRLAPPTATEPTSSGRDTDRGLLMVQIDGLARSTLIEAVDTGIMPNLRRLIDEEGYRLHPVYSGLPSTTPAFEAELFYGVPLAVPAFTYMQRSTGRIMRMWQRDAVASVQESVMHGQRPLLAGGSSYCNIYTGGAREARFCMASLGWTDPFRTHHPLTFPLVALLYGGDAIRALALVVRELAAAPGGLLAAVAGGQDLGSELKFASSRVAVEVIVREFISLCAQIDLARGLPIVHLDLIGYDECAHRRGSGSPLSRRTLTDLDAAVGRLVTAAGRAGARAYDVWVLADHGQEDTVPYIEHHGRPVRDAVADVLARYGIDVLDSAGHERIGERLLGVFIPGLDAASSEWQGDQAAVTAQGPVGHVYLPTGTSPEVRDSIAAELVRDAGIPLVLAAAGKVASAWTAEGPGRLPDDAARILGDDHPYLDAAAEDLVALCRHPDAGDLVICGWHAGARPVSFPHENGSHGGPGPRETDAWVLAPSHTDLPAPAHGPRRAADLRKAAIAMLHEPPGVAFPTERGSRGGPSRKPGAVRIMTYNVHSCVGLDGTLSPERVARVIARYDPDVVALQELDVARQRTGGVDQARRLADVLQMLLHFHPALRVGEERYGDAFLSRLPMRILRAGPLPALARNRPLEPRGALRVEITLPHGRLQVINTHLSLHPAERRLQVDALLGPGWLGGIEAGEGVLCGDFNAFGWSPVCRRIGRVLRDVQAGDARHRPRATWVGGVRLGRIDHVFVDPAIVVSRVWVADDSLARVASDHLPVLVDLHVT